MKLMMMRLLINTILISLDSKTLYQVSEIEIRKQVKWWPIPDS